MSKFQINNQDKWAINDWVDSWGGGHLIWQPFFDGIFT